MNHRLQAVGDHDQGTPRRQARERLLDSGFVFRIGESRRLVENQDRRIFQEGASDGQALPLAARQAVAALSQDGLVTARFAFDEVMSLCRLGGGDNLRMRRVRSTEREVLGDGAAEQENLLKNSGDLAVQRRLIHIAQIHATDPHAALVRIERPRDQPGQG